MDIQYLHEKPLVAVFDNFIESSICSDILNLYLHPGFWKQSLGYDHKTHTTKVTTNRNSHTCDLPHQAPLIVALRDRVANLLNIPVERVENLQAQRYNPGEYFKHHHDYFFSGPLLNNNRLATLIIYLNDDFTGGGTTFHKLHFSVLPRAGRALYFQYNYDSTTNYETVHSGEPVISGKKYIITAWIRGRRWTDA